MPITSIKFNLLSKFPVKFDVSRDKCIGLTTSVSNTRSGTSDSKIISGTSGSETISGTSGSKITSGTSDSDTISGTSGSDTISATSDSNTISPPIRYDSVAFAGGGAKGVGHLGVIAVLGKDLEYIQEVAGASAGSIIAVLVGLGFSAEEIKTEFFKEEPTLNQNALQRRFKDFIKARFQDEDENKIKETLQKKLEEENHTKYQDIENLNLGNLTSEQLKSIQENHPQLICDIIKTWFQENKTTETLPKDNNNNNNNSIENSGDLTFKQLDTIRKHYPELSYNFIKAEFQSEKNEIKEMLKKELKKDKDIKNLNLGNLTSQQLETIQKKHSKLSLDIIKTWFKHQENEIKEILKKELEEDNHRKYQDIQTLNLGDLTFKQLDTIRKNHPELNIKKIKLTATFMDKEAKNGGIASEVLLSAETTPNMSIVEGIIASCALPVLHKPVKIRNEDFFDGAIYGNHNPQKIIKLRDGGIINNLPFQYLNGKNILVVDFKKNEKVHTVPKNFGERMRSFIAYGFPVYESRQAISHTLDEYSRFYTAFYVNPHYGVDNEENSIGTTDDEKNSTGKTNSKKIKIIGTTDTRKAWKHRKEIIENVRTDFLKFFQNLELKKSDENLDPDKVNKHRNTIYFAKKKIHEIKTKAI